MFTDADVTNLTFVRCARHLGLSLDAIAEIMTLADGGVRPCDRTRTLLAQRLREIDTAITDLQHLRARIVATQTVDVTGDSSSRCPVIEHADLN